MEKILPYKDLRQTLTGIKIQIKESRAFMDNFLPSFDYNESVVRQLWQQLKPITTYAEDGEREVLQSAETLFTSKNIHNFPGAGDCDCFTIAVTAACQILNLPCLIVLAGRSPGRAVHIYNEIKCNYSGRWVKFDLTAPELNQARFYPYKQRIRANYTK